MVERHCEAWALSKFIDADAMDSRYLLWGKQRRAHHRAENGRCFTLQQTDLDDVIFVNVQPSSMIDARIHVCMCAGTRTRSYS